MQRHILDRPQKDRAAALDKAVKIEMQNGPHRATLALQRRPRRENAAQRARHYWAISKSEEA